MHLLHKVYKNIVPKTKKVNELKKQMKNRFKLINLYLFKPTFSFKKKTLNPKLNKMGLLKGKIALRWSLQSTKLLNSFQGEKASTIAYFQKNSFTFSLNRMTPYEA